MKVDVINPAKKTKYDPQVRLLHLSHPIRFKKANIRSARVDETDVAGMLQNRFVLPCQRTEQSR